MPMLEPERALPPATFRAWETLAAGRRLPDQLYLAGDSALAVHLRHRDTHGLQFLYHENAVDLVQLARELPLHTPFAVSASSPALLSGVVMGATVELIHADEPAPQTLLEKTTRVAGLSVAGLQDLTAMKLKRIVDAGELGDYYDLMTIDQEGGIAVEDAIPLFLERYRLPWGCEAMVRLVNALGYLTHAGDDETVPIRRGTLARWWARRQARVVRALSDSG
jgi:hypothetical protein